MKSGNMLFDMTGEALCKVLYARMEFQKKNYTKALVIRFLRKMERWNKLSCHCLSSLHCGWKLTEGKLCVLKYLEPSATYLRTVKLLSWELLWFSRGLDISSP